MDIKKFDYNKSYNFTGIFWFENEYENRFSGSLDYTPEKGIKLSLISFTENGGSYLPLDGYCAIQKMFGTVQQDGKGLNITLLDVLLNEGTISCGSNGCSKTLHGSARILIANAHLQNDRIKYFDILYDDNFKSLFFYHTSSENVCEVLPYAKKPIRLSNLAISFDVFYSAIPLYSADQLENLFCEIHPNQKKSSLKSLKNITSKFLETHQDVLGIRKNSEAVIKFKGNSFSVNRYLKAENKWRAFFELLLDQPIVINSAWIAIEYDAPEGKKYTSSKPVLFQQYPQPNRNITHWHKFLLPINIDAFEGNGNLSRIQQPYEKWNTLYNDKKWQMVLYSLRSIIYKRDLIRQEDFLILISYIETVLDLLGNQITNIEQIIELYATSMWKKEFNKLLKDLPKNVSIGINVHELRNCIAHPKSAEKKKENTILWFLMRF